MTQFALIRSLADLARACEDLSGFFAARRQQNPRLSPEALLGLWLEPKLAAETPLVLNIPDSAGALQPVRIPESIGVSAIWTLCWLDVPDEPDGKLCRLRLLEALLELSDVRQDEALQGRFIPVFSDAVPESDVQAEYCRLGRRYPDILLKPLFQERHTGRLLVPGKYDAWPGAGR